MFWKGYNNEIISIKIENSKNENNSICDKFQVKYMRVHNNNNNNNNSR